MQIRDFVMMYSERKNTNPVLSRAMLEQALDALLVFEEGRFVDCNSAAEQVFGFTRTELLTCSPLALTPYYQPDGRDSLTAALDYIRIAQTGKVQRIEWLARRKDKSTFLAEAVISKLEYDEHTYLLAAIRDISESRAVQVRLQKQSNDFRVLLENFPGGVSLIDANLRLVAWNQDLMTLLDINPVTIQDDHPFIADVLSDSILTGNRLERVQLTQLEKQSRLKKILQVDSPFHSDLEADYGRIIEVRVSPIAEGGFVLTCSDVTEKRNISAEFKRQSVFLRAVISHMPQGLSVFDEYWRLQIWNSQYVSAIGFPKHLVYQGVHYEELLRFLVERGDYGPGDVEEIVQERLSVASQYLDHNFERTRPNGVTHLIHGIPVREEGKLKGYITTYTDISRIKQAEQALADANTQLERNVADKSEQLQRTQQDLMRSEKLAALGSLVAGVAHELNTPIGNTLLTSSTLGGITRELIKKIDTGNLRRSEMLQYLHDAQQACSLIEHGLRHAAELVTSFKEVAIDQASSKRRKFNVAKVCNDVLATMRAKLKQSKVTLHVDIPMQIELDSYPGPFDQVICNLIDNSILHGFAGNGGNIFISGAMGNHERFELHVSDDGNGIPHEFLGRIFDPFFTTKFGQGGSGLGLHIVYNIVTDVLGGQIRASHHSPRGASFIIKLPLVAPKLQS